MLIYVAFEVTISIIFHTSKHFALFYFQINQFLSAANLDLSIV